MPLGNKKHKNSSPVICARKMDQFPESKLLPQTCCCRDCTMRYFFVEKTIAGERGPKGDTGPGSQFVLKTFDQPGDYSFQVPQDVHFLWVSVVGAGGAGTAYKQGNDLKGGAGGGGASFLDQMIPVYQGQKFNMTVGRGGKHSNGPKDTTRGGDTIFKVVTNDNNTNNSGGSLWDPNIKSLSIHDSKSKNRDNNNSSKRENKERGKTSRGTEDESPESNDSKYSDDLSFLRDKRRFDTLFKTFNANYEFIAAGGYGGTKDSGGNGGGYDGTVPLLSYNTGGSSTTNVDGYSGMAIPKFQGSGGGFFYHIDAPTSDDYGVGGGGKVSIMASAPGFIDDERNIIAAGGSSIVGLGGYVRFDAYEDHYGDPGYSVDHSGDFVTSTNKIVEGKLTFVLPGIGGGGYAGFIYRDEEAAKISIPIALQSAGGDGIVLIRYFSPIRNTCNNSSSSSGGSENDNSE